MGLVPPPSGPSYLQFTAFLYNADPDTKIQLSLRGLPKWSLQIFDVRGSIDSHLFQTLHCDWKLYPRRWHIAVRAKKNKEVNGRPPLKKGIITASRGRGEGGRGGVLSTFLCGVRCAARFSKFWPYFRPKMHLISFHTRFQTWPLRNDVIIEKLMKEMKSFLILFMSYKTSLREHFSSLTV